MKNKDEGQRRCDLCVVVINTIKQVYPALLQYYVIECKYIDQFSIMVFKTLFCSPPLFSIRLRTLGKGNCCVLFTAQVFMLSRLWGECVLVSKHCFQLNKLAGYIQRCFVPHEAFGEVNFLPTQNH